MLLLKIASVFEQLGTSSRGIKRFLLDIDERFCQFYAKSLFARYNLFNQHFFDDDHKTGYSTFLREANKLCVIIDPPYGGLIQLIAHTICTIRKSTFVLCCRMNE